MERDLRVRLLARGVCGFGRAFPRPAHGSSVDLQPINVNRWPAAGSRAHQGSWAGAPEEINEQDFWDFQHPDLPRRLRCPEENGEVGSLKSSEGGSEMLQLSVCIEWIFEDRDFPARIDAVAEAGLPAIEFWGWQDKDLPAIIERKEHHGLAVATVSLDPPVYLLDGDAIPAFVQGVRESCRIAQQLDCETLTTDLQDIPFGAGQPWYSFLANEGQRALRQIQRDNIVRAFKAVAPIAEGEGITLLLEPLNTLDHGGYFLASSQEGFEIIQEVGSPAVRLLFDVYHQQITEGNLINNLTRHIDLVAHLHVADVPDRRVPGTGEINFLNVLEAAKHAGYDGYVGLEYMPRGDDSASLEPIRQIVDQVNRG
jgi:hydroxypyruvate isomerase